MHGNHRARLLQGEVHLAAAMLRRDGARRDEVKELGTVTNLASQRLGPLRAWRDAFVVPDVEAQLVQVLNLGIHQIPVLV